MGKNITKHDHFIDQSQQKNEQFALQITNKQKFSNHIYAIINQIYLNKKI